MSCAPPQGVGSLRAVVLNQAYLSLGPLGSVWTRFDCADWEVPLLRGSRAAAEHPAVHRAACHKRSPKPGVKFEVEKSCLSVNALGCTREGRESGPPESRINL